MKTKQNSLIIVFIFLVIVFKITLAETVYISPSSLTIIQYIEDGITGYTTGGNYQIGRLDESGVQIRYRTRYEFYLASVPYDARIDSVKISYNINNGGSSSNKARFVKLPDEYYGESDQWGRFTSSGTVYASNLSYNQDYPDKKYSQLTADVTTAIQGDHFFCIGFMSENESTNGTYANVYISFITVYYSPKVTVTIQNSFGDGKVEIDGQLQDSPYASSTWYAGDSHNIRAYTQIINAITYPFPTPGTWKNITTGEEKSQINNNTPISISPGDNCIWQANFNPATANIIVDQKLSSGASTGSIGLWTGANFTEYSVPKSFSFPFSSNQILRGEQQITSQEKYNYWEKGQDQDNDVKNHHVFQIDQSIPGYLTARFKPTFGGISIQTNFFEVSEIYNSNIQFKDPWFIDYADPNCGNNYRNRGNDAVFRTRTTPFVIDYSTTYENNQSYKGVFLNQNPKFEDNIPIYSLKVPQPHTVNLGGAIGVRPVYFLNWSYDANKATLKYPNASETPVVFKTSDATITANLKASLISSSSSAFSNDSRRKFVRTQDGWLHMVYESEGHIWYEAKPPDGDWRLIKVPGNNGHPYLDVNGGSSPAMDCYNIDDWNEYRVYISFKEGNYIQVYRFAYYSYANNYAYDGMCNLYIAESFYSPNIASSKDGFFMIVYKTSSGINYRLGAGEPGNGIWILPKYGIISGTNSNSESAAISGISLETGWSSFDIAWLQLTPPPPAPPLVSVKYCQLEYDHLYNNVTYSAPPQTVSSSSMKINSNPSIISLPDVPRIGWIADMSGTYDPWQTYATMCKIYPSISYNMYNYQSKSASINKLDNDSKYYFTWSQVYYMYGWIKNNFAVCSTSPNVIKNLNTWGQDLQLCNGPNSSNMYVLSFYPYSTPYYFVKSNSLGSAGLGKTTEYPYSGKRGIVLENNNAGLYYSIGNIAVDGVSINFIPNVDEISKRGNRDSVKYHGSKSIYNNTETVNGLLVSEPFDLKKDSQIEFNDYFGVADSVAGVSVLGENGYITFKVELLDDASDKVIGTIKESEFTIRNLRPNELSAYKLSRGLPAGRKVKIRIVLSTNVENPQWSIIDDYMDLKDGLKKISAKEISLESSEFITDYALHRAYPNPFNPKTTFRFDLPEETHVEIVVYDLMGREVWKSAKTHYSAGTYSVVWNGVNQSGQPVGTGMYIVRLKSLRYSATQKVLLMK